MFLVQKRKKDLEKEVKGKQRSDLARSDLKLLDTIGRGASGEGKLSFFPLELGPY